jgi:HlyD family secretion protein
MLSKKNVIIVLILLAAVAIYAWFLTGNQKKDAALTLYGNVDIREVDLSFRVGGKVETLFVDEGDIVHPGDVVAILDRTPYEDEWRKAAAEVEFSKVVKDNAMKNFERRKNAIQSLAVSQEELDNALAEFRQSSASLDAAKASLALATVNLEDTKLLAPSSGTILTRIRERGSVVAKTEPIFTLSLDSPIWVRAYISEPELGRIYPGMKAKILTDTPSNPTYFGHIGFISPMAEFTPKNVETQKLRTDLVYRLRVIIDNPDKGLRQGMPVTVELMEEPAKKGSSH